jgi:hypothetical protein
MNTPLCENKSYAIKSKPYMELHRKQIEDLRDKVKANIGCAYRNYYFECECGTKVGFHTFRFHLATQKHRKVCGDLPMPPTEEEVIEK